MRICEQREGVREAGVYMDGEKKTVPVCAHCVYEAMRKNFYSIGFGAGLQLCWFVVASKGLASLPGMFAAVIALYGLVRLVMLLAARLVLRAAQPKAALCRSGRGNMPWPGPLRRTPARCVCRAVLQCEGADTARVRAPARGKVTGLPRPEAVWLARRL